MIAELHRRNATVEEAQAILFAHNDLLLEGVFTFSIDDAVSVYPASVDRVALQRILDLWSLEFGSLAAESAEHFFMANPVWRRPMIRTLPGEYFCPIIGLGISFCLELMEEVVATDDDLRSLYQERGGDFLEESVAKLIRNGIPMARIADGVSWSDPATPGTLYENDLVVLVDSLLLVVESKSGRLTDAARRGGDKTVRRDAENLVIEPARQAKRFADYLRAHPGVHEFQMVHGGTFRVDTSRISDIASVSVTLDQLGTLGARWTALREAGFLSTGDQLAPTIALPDLEVIFSVLERPAERLHYLTRRAEFERSADYVGDELDLLAFYCDRGFSIGDYEGGGVHLQLWGMSRRFDRYFMQLLGSADDGGKREKKPPRRLTKWWRDMLDRLEQTRPDGWLTMSFRLLDTAYEDQDKFERGYRAAGRRLRKDWPRFPNGLHSVLRFGGKIRPTAIVGLTFRHVVPPQHRELLHAAIEETATEAGTDRVLGIGNDITREDYPYGIIACPNLDGSIFDATEQ